MSVTIDGNTGVSLVQDGVITDSNLPSGSVLQVVQAVSSVSILVSSGGGFDVNPSVSITPSSTSSKILILHSAGGMVNGSASAIGFALKRNSTFIWQAGRYGFSNSSGWVPVPFHLHYLDSPNTTSEVTYTPHMYLEAVTGALLRHNDSDGDVFSAENDAITIAMEIAG